jgi:hypothetical protein
VTVIPEFFSGSVICISILTPEREMDHSNSDVAIKNERKKRGKNASKLRTSQEENRTVMKREEL